MTKEMRCTLAEVGAVILCLAPALRSINFLEGAEFSGGHVTAPLVSATTTAALVLFVTIPVAFFYRRLAAAMALTAALFCVPIYLYVVFPGAFRRLFGGDYSVPTPARHFDDWAVGGLLAVLIAVSVSLPLLRRPNA